mmetsp:Transcript_55413/g.125942  ORF Transcript_55413/g.125942 Transcript_55413/m.125942 type:complete len:197 (-) Transcript_55413:214-804(-)
MPKAIYSTAINMALRPKCDSKQRGEALIIAAGAGDIFSMQRLLGEFEVNPNYLIPGERRTALMAAVIFDQAACVRILLQSGADPTIRDKHGKTALDMSAEASLDHSADVIYKSLQKHVDRGATRNGADMGVHLRADHHGVRGPYTSDEADRTRASYEASSHFSRASRSAPCWTGSTADDSKNTADSELNTGDSELN